MATDLTHIQVGDMLALRLKNRSVYDRVSHGLLIVERITATQVGCRNEQGGSGEWRFRKSDGKEIGRDYSYAELATPELIAEVKAQRALLDRDIAARRALSDLEGRYLHQLRLSLEQTEALAKAWTEIKAMAPAAG